ncbi:MAG: hypothetical protein ACLGGX_12665 [Bdellovibrionia bacterium]
MNEFDKYNKGLASVGKFSAADYTTLVEAYMSGRYWDMKKLYKKNLDVDTILSARDAGVPMLFPSYKETLTEAGEKFLFKHGFPYILPYVHMNDKKFGFKSLWNYADLQADFYLSEWYVKWADAFQVGEPLDSLEKSLEMKSQLMKQDKTFSEITKPQPGVFEISYVRNNLAQFGRKLIELQVLSEQEKLNITAEDLRTVESILQQAKEVNEHILKLKAANRPVSQAEIKWAYQSFRMLMEKANQALPIERIVPRVLRQAHGDYRNFWFDTFAVLLPRPEGLTKFLSAKGIWAEAKRQRLERAKARAKGIVAPAVDLKAAPVVVADLEKQLAAHYNESRRGQEVSEEKLSSNFYLNRLFNYQKAFTTQVQSVFIPQVMEFSHLTNGEQRQIVETVETFEKIMANRMREFASDYQKIFVEYERDPSVMERLVNTESDLKWAVDRGLHAMADTLDLLDEGKKIKSIEKHLSVLSEITHKLEKREAVTRGLRDILRNVLPFKKGTGEMVCSLITKLCIKNEKLMNFFEKMPLGPLSNNKKVVISFKDSQNKETTKPQLPANAVVVMVMNHEHAMLDLATMKEVAKGLEIDTSSVLTNKEVWPIYDYRTNKDSTIIFKQEKGIKQRVLDLMDSYKKRFMFAIYPEGDLPYFGANFPIPAHFGAFNIARSAAVNNKGKRPVYLVKVFSNFQEATNSDGKVAFKVEISLPELVPAEEIKGSRDSWIEEKRAEFEKEALEKRGTQQVDLINREKIKGTRVRAVAPVAEYNSAGKFMTDFMKMDGRTVNTCNRLFIDL